MHFMGCDFYFSPFQTSDMEFWNSINIIVTLGEMKGVNLVARPKNGLCNKYLCYTEVESVSAIPKL